jgi:hypothetical protein
LTHPTQLFRILKLARSSAAIQRFHRAFVIGREELVLFGATAGILLCVAAVGIDPWKHEVQRHRSKHRPLHVALDATFPVERRMRCVGAEP